MKANSAKGGRNAQTPEAYAARIANSWPELTGAQKSIIRTILSPVLHVRTRGPYKKAS
jgi:hypothetical protein